MALMTAGVSPNSGDKAAEVATLPLDHNLCGLPKVWDAPDSVSVLPYLILLYLRQI